MVVIELEVEVVSEVVGGDMTEKEDEAVSDVCVVEEVADKKQKDEELGDKKLGKTDMRSLIVDIINNLHYRD